MENFMGCLDGATGAFFYCCVGCGCCALRYFYMSGGGVGVDVLH